MPSNNSNNNTAFSKGSSLLVLLLAVQIAPASAFSSISSAQHQPATIKPTVTKYRAIRHLSALQTDNSEDQQQQQQDDSPRSIKASALPDTETPLIKIDDTSRDSTTKDSSGNTASTGTINERLMVELQDAADQEKYGAKSGFGKKMGLSGRRNEKSPEEMEAALAEARDLNGVNPVVALTGGVFAFVVAGGLWYATQKLGTFFALHPVATDVYFVQRLASVFRNVVMGLASLASGFFGVTGMGIFLLGVKVAIGVAKGELDPTPIVKKKDSNQVEMPNVWDLMMNKKPKRQGGRNGIGNGIDDNNPFGL